MLMAALSVTPVQAQSVATTFRTGEHPGKTRFVLELSEKPEYTIFTLDEPYRIVIDFKGVDWQVAPSLHKRGQGVIEGIRNGSSDASNHRVVLDLAGPALVLNDFMLDPDDGYPWLFVLDLSRTSRAAFQTARNGIVAAPASQMARAPTPSFLRLDEIVAAPAVAPLFPPLQPGPRTTIAGDRSITTTAQADGLSDFSFGSLQRKIAVFDPAGRHLIRPLVRRVPGLTAKGSYYFSSGVLLQKNDGAGFREKDFRLLQAQNVFEAEFSYRISQGLSVTSVNHFLYDAVYHIENAQGLFADKVNREFEYYDDFDRIARELYVSYRTPKTDLVVGKQQIAWGKMDGRFIDVINSMDERESVQLESADYERRRLPLWMVNGTYYFENASVNLLWIPDHAENINPGYGSPWLSPQVPPTDQMARSNSALLAGEIDAFGDSLLLKNDPDWQDFGDHQFAARLDSAIGKLTWGLIYFYAWERNASNVVVGSFMSGANPQLIFRPNFSRLHHFGFTSDYAWTASSVPVVGSLPMVLRVEALYTTGVRFADANRQADARAGNMNKGLSEHNTLRAAVALELALPDNLSVSFQPSFYMTQNWNNGLGSGFGGAAGDKWALAPVLFAQKPIRATRDRLKISGTITPYLSWPNRGFQGAKFRATASYELSQYMRSKITFTTYSGGDNDDLFGQYGDYDNIGIEFSYDF
jgi:hypothetical protein